MGGGETVAIRIPRQRRGLGRLETAPAAIPRPAATTRATASSPTTTSEKARRGAAAGRSGKSSLRIASRKRVKSSIWTRSSNHFLHRLHVDRESFQKLRRHDVEAYRELQLDQRRRRQFGGNGGERRIGRAAQGDDFIGEWQRRALQLVKAGGRFPVLQRGVLLVGDADILADALVRDTLVGRLAQDPGARDGEFTHHRVEFALVADRAAEPAILFKIAR